MDLVIFIFEVFLNQLNICWIDKNTNYVDALVCLNAHEEKKKKKEERKKKVTSGN